MEKKTTSWVKRRHPIIRDLAAVVLAPYCRWRYNIKIEPFREQGDRSYLILLNHQTPFDQFFVAAAFRGAVYYMATEDIFSLGWVSSLIRWLVAPIPIKKQTTDLRAIKYCLQVAKEGGTIAIAPEGNRTYSGRTEYMNPSIATLARKLKLPIVLFRVEGGYGAQPRWSDVVRRGPMRAYVSQVIEPEEYAAMTSDELFSVIETGLYVDEAVLDQEFHSSKRAEYLERAIYVCPDCGLSKFESHSCKAHCTTCGKTILYGADKRISGVGFDFPFSFMAEWYEYQKNFVRALDITPYLETPMFRDQAKLSEVILYKRKKTLRPTTEIRLYGDRVVFDEGKENQLVLPFAEITAAAVLGRNKLNLYHNQTVYQLKGSKRFNALKYVNLYFHYKNITEGNADGGFLGL